MWRLFLGLFGGWRWVRRWHGGHWELWNIDSPVNGQCWLDVPECSRRTGVRPTGLCRGTPTCEDYR